MITKNLKSVVYISLLISWLGFEFCAATSNSITTTSFLTDPETLVSINANFELGFFHMNSSRNRYLGIWFTKNDIDGMLQVIWVANRDKPLKDSSGMLKISDDGNLNLVDSENKIYWTSNTTSDDVNISVAKLQETGNLVLLQNVSDTIIWQSFDDPTDSLLPGQKLTLTKSMTDNTFRAWKSPDDPSRGHFRYVSLPRSLPEFFVVDADTDEIHWRTGPWNGDGFLGVSGYPAEGYFAFRIDDHGGMVNLSYMGNDYPLRARFILGYDGSLRQKSWNEDTRNWSNVWESYDSQCDVYGKCGHFAVCNPKTTPICECLEGFEPVKVDEWKNGNWSSGCDRRTALQCQNPRGKEDEFLQLNQVKVPDYAQIIQGGPADCESLCLQNCSCLAYSSYIAVGCMLWNVSLIDIQQFSDHGAELFIRLAHSDLPGAGAGAGDKWRKRIVVIVILSAIASVILMRILWKWKNHRHGSI